MRFNKLVLAFSDSGFQRSIAYSWVVEIHESYVRVVSKKYLKPNLKFKKKEVIFDESICVQNVQLLLT